MLTLALVHAHSENCEGGACAAVAPSLLARKVETQTVNIPMDTGINGTTLPFVGSASGLKIK